MKGAELTVLCSCHSEANIGASVIVLSIIIYNAPFQILFFQLRIAIHGLVLMQMQEKLRDFVVDDKEKQIT